MIKRQIKKISKKLLDQWKIHRYNAWYKNNTKEADKGVLKKKNLLIVCSFCVQKGGKP